MSHRFMCQEYRLALLTGFAKHVSIKGDYFINFLKKMLLWVKVQLNVYLIAQACKYLFHKRHMCHSFHKKIVMAGKHAATYSFNLCPENIGI